MAFCWHSVIATIGDDSVSYLTLARHLSVWNPDPLAAPWAPYFSNFPPLFPLLLAVTGGAYDLFIAHMVVAAGGVACVFLVAAYARAWLAGECAALGVTALFLVLPGTWLALTGILSESTYLALSLAALLYGATRVGPQSPTRSYAVLGLWMAAALLSRTAGFALLLGYAAQVGFAAWRRRALPEPRAWLPLAIGVAAQLAWLALRPKLAVPAYQQWLGVLGEAWLQHPAATFAESWQYLSRGWIGNFASDAAGGASAALFFGLVAVAALAGAVRAARDERLDGWYVLVSVAMLVLWRFNEDNSRRLLFPLLPLALVHAAESVRAIARRFREPLRAWIPALAFAFVAVMVLPASQLILRKSLERAPYYPGLGYSPSSMKDYYGIVNERQAREEAGRGAAVLAGMSYLEGWTPPGARVMWVRPEYIAVLGKREGVPLYLRWDRATLARAIVRTRTDFVVASRQFKNDLAADTADAFLWIARDLPAYLVPVAILPDPARGDFTLLRVEADALQRYIRETEGAPPGPAGPAR